MKSGELTLGCLVASVASALGQAQSMAAFLQTKSSSSQSVPMLLSRASVGIPFAFAGDPGIAGAQSTADILDVGSSRVPIMIAASELERLKPDKICILRLGFEYAGEGFVLASSTLARG